MLRGPTLGFRRPTRNAKCTRLNVLPSFSPPSFFPPFKVGIKRNSILYVTTLEGIEDEIWCTVLIFGTRNGLLLTGNLGCLAIGEK